MNTNTTRSTYLRRCFSTAFALALALASARAASAQTLDAALDKAARLYSATKTARGALEQTVINSLTQARYNSKAEYQQQFPHKMSINFTDPRGDRIVVDGSFVWLYTPSMSPGVVTKAPISAAATWLNLINVALNSDRSKFKFTDAGRETVQNVQTRVVLVTPLQPTLDLIHAKFWIDEATGRVPQFEVKETADRTRRIRFTDLRLEAAVDTSQFMFVVPRGVTVESRGG